MVIETLAGVTAALSGVGALVTTLLTWYQSRNRDRADKVTVTIGEQRITVHANDEGYAELRALLESLARNSEPNQPDAGADGDTEHSGPPSRA